MSKRANPTVIGAFVVGAVVLFVMSLLAITGGAFLAEKTRYVMFFQGSVKGLNIGAPLSFRGVRIGEVSDIRLLQRQGEYLIPVYVEVDVDRLESLYGGKLEHASSAKLIEQGMRAKLELQSLLTGQLFIQLDILPDEPANMIDIDSDIPQLPTVSTPLEKLGKALQDFPVQELLQKIMSTVDGIDKLVNSPDTQEIPHSLNTSLKDIDSLVKHLDEKVGPLSSKAEVALDEGANTLVEARKALLDARVAIKEANATLQNTTAITDENSELIINLNTALEEISNAAIAVRRLAETVEQQPETLLRGKQK